MHMAQIATSRPVRKLGLVLRCFALGRMHREVSGQSVQSSAVGSDDGACDELPSFWEAYRTLAQCYQAEVARLTTHTHPSVKELTHSDKELTIPKQETSIRSVLSNTRSGRARRPSFAENGLGSAELSAMRETVDERNAPAPQVILLLVSLKFARSCTQNRWIVTMRTPRRHLQFSDIPQGSGMARACRNRIVFTFHLKDHPKSWHGIPIEAYHWPPVAAAGVSSA